MKVNFICGELSEKIKKEAQLLLWKKIRMTIKEIKHEH